jgi:hypothetical protein
VRRLPPRIGLAKLPNIDLSLEQPSKLEYEAF